MPASPRLDDGYANGLDHDGRGKPPRSKRLSITQRLRDTLSHVGRHSSATAAAPPAKQSPIPRIRLWLDACNAHHGRHCSGQADDDIATWRPVRLIDAVDRCLVLAKPTDRYTALSYVWGTERARDGPDAAAQLLSSNAQDWQLGLPDKGIPRTMLDAIWLSKKLGVRYIWIDRLCIMHDDAADRADHVQHMAYLFANAYLTIVAAHGDVNTGLLALDPRRLARSPRAGSPDHADLLAASKWQTRAWTMQELLYARRAVFCFEEAVTWECHCQLWQASTSPSVVRSKRNECTSRQSLAAHAFEHAPWPDMDEYARIVMDYSARKLTLVDDSLAALEGTMYVLSTIFDGGFVYAMPAMFLDIALLWRPQATIRRRAFSHPPFLPSWSWLGWWFDGIPVDVLLWRAACDYVEAALPAQRSHHARRFQPSHSFRIRPVVTWYLTDRTNTMPVATSGLHHRDLRLRRSSAAPLPPGWSRAGSHFQHHSDHSTLFKYPIPVQDLPQDPDYLPRPPPPPPPGPLLSFKTTCAFFDVDYAISMVVKDKPNPPLAVGNIWSTAGKWIGELRAHDAWLGVQSSNYDGQEKLEFIAISIAMERRASYVFSLDRFEENMDKDEIVEFVNVLWIERIAGIAYRRGLGHVLLEAWEAQAGNEVDILLG
ncbi:hypothetical protein CDD81_4102 [Ophiocordyceps australis]|uniref:Heterokaryon incompatibility domain-containing protein n=1 Tax=Ophiocordyceps australis TaxID=1399860 RepID=A0A2C5YCR0_9HYPO|nr:hypothetical protein CDD81_4102 [Ophiocordyceps australis]